MAVCRQDMVYKDYTNNPIPTSFFIPDMILWAMHVIRLLRKKDSLKQKKGFRDGVICVVFV